MFGWGIFSRKSSPTVTRKQGLCLRPSANRGLGHFTVMGCIFICTFALLIVHVLTTTSDAKEKKFIYGKTQSSSPITSFENTPQRWFTWVRPSSFEGNQRHLPQGHPSGHRSTRLSCPHFDTSSAHKCMCLYCMFWILGFCTYLLYAYSCNICLYAHYNCDALSVLFCYHKHIGRTSCFTSLQWENGCL